MRDLFLFSEFHTERVMRMKQMVMIDLRTTPSAILSEHNALFLYYNIYFSNYITYHFILFGTADILHERTPEGLIPLYNIWHCHFWIIELIRPIQNLCLWLLKYILSIYSNSVFKGGRTYGFLRKNPLFAEVHIKKTRFIKQRYFADHVITKYRRKKIFFLHCINSNELCWVKTIKSN